MQKIVALILLMIAGTIYLGKQAHLVLINFRPAPAVALAQIIDGSADPLQIAVGASDGAEMSVIKLPWNDGVAVLEPRARYKVAGRVLSYAHYYLEDAAELAPVDLALGWDRLALAQAPKGVTFDHGNRFYHFYIAQSEHSIDANYVYLHSSNIHLIPANQTLKKLILSLRSNELIELSGYLVDVTNPQRPDWHCEPTPI